MKIAIASGKGGTGKTTVATSLTCTLARRGHDVAYLDCDVEEPNGHIFLRPRITRAWPLGVPLPKVDPDLCTGCGECGRICEYKAIAVINKKVLIFPELCHSCGGCSLVCPEGAIQEAQKVIGTVEEGVLKGAKFAHGRLQIGEVLSGPLIHEVKKCAPRNGIAIIDSPPGTSCPVIEAVRGADFLILVTEPTPFGLNDLKLAVEMARALKLRIGIVLNRCNVGDDGVQKYCADEGIDILLEIPDDRRVAEAYSRGAIPADAVEGYEDLFDRLWKRICNPQE